jgi:undecaprenyl-diphosphatase
MSWFEAMMLGLVQGLTEFLPVSSSGHLQIGNALLNTGVEENLTFAVAVHAATVLSTLLALRKEIYILIRDALRIEWNNSTRYLFKIALSMIPVAIVGLFFKDAVESLFSSGLVLTGACLLLTAVLLTFASFARPRERKDIGFRDAIVIGLAQALAILPGLSRSGATISTGLLLGNQKESVARFSFLMVLVPILGEAVLDLSRGGFSAASSGIPAFSLMVGFLTAFLSGYVACRWMLRLVQRGKLIYFALYCALLGMTTLIIL